MRVMIVGQKWLAAELLRLCLARGDDVAAVSAPRMDDRLAALATAEGIPVCQVPKRLTGEWVPAGVDVLLCANAHVFVTAEARGKARLGALGYHPSLLPRHRGRDAIRWALHMGDVVTGGTVYWLDDGADTADFRRLLEELRYREAMRRVAKTCCVWLGGAAFVLAVIAGYAEMTDACVATGAIALGLTTYGIL